MINQQKAIKARYHARYWIYLKECELYMSHNACGNVGNDKIKSYSTITGTKLREFQWIISWNVQRNMLELEAHEICRSHEQQFNNLVLDPTLIWDANFYKKIYYIKCDTIHYFLSFQIGHDIYVYTLNLTSGVYELNYMYYLLIVRYL